MQHVDRKTIRSFGIPGPVLMERAGLAVVDCIEEAFTGRKALVVAGTGNNGGDGIMVARELRNRACDAGVLIAGKKERLSPDCRRQYEIAGRFGVPMRFGFSPRPGELHGSFIVDALFGTGLGKPVKGSLKRTIEAINSSGCKVVSVDMPSGVSADTGQVLGAAVRADITVTFGALKRGHLLYPGAELSGEVMVRDIGFPRELVNAISCNVLGASEMGLILPERAPSSHKGDYGHLLVVAGSQGKTGAAFMASEAALRAGAGLVTMASPEKLAGSYQARATEAMVLVAPSTPSGGFAQGALDPLLEFASSNATAIALGPGLGQHPDTARLVRELVKRSPAPLVLDADGINALGKDAAGILRGARSPVVITPHPGEFVRISGLSKSGIQADRPAAALSFARASGAYVVLKGAPTIVAGPERELFINTTGGPALAKGGTGDVLTGMAGAFLARGMVPLEAALLGVYLHGLCGDLAAEGLGENSVVATDLLGLLPEAFGLLSGEV